LVARDDFQPDNLKHGGSDMGYPRLVTNHESSLVVMYYWATKEIPQGHIAATIAKIGKISSTKKTEN